MTSHKEWLANYRVQKAKERSARDAQSSKLNTTYLNEAMRDQVLVKAFETGAARSKPAAGPIGALGHHARRFIGNGRRIHPVSPDRAASLRRKRKWGGSSCLPDWMRQHYTEGERAVLAIVVQRVNRSGHCDLAINAIAALAGVHRTTVQNALRRARHLKHVTVQERPGVAGQLSLTNVVRILCGAWKAWLRRVGSGFKKPNPSEMKRERKEKVAGLAPSQWAYERDEAAIPVGLQPGPVTAALTFGLTEDIERSIGIHVDGSAQPTDPMCWRRRVAIVSKQLLPSDRLLGGNVGEPNVGG